MAGLCTHAVCRPTPDAGWATGRSHLLGCSSPLRVSSPPRCNGDPLEVPEAPGSCTSSRPTGASQSTLTMSMVRFDTSAFILHPRRSTLRFARVVASTRCHAIGFAYRLSFCIHLLEAPLAPLVVQHSGISCACSCCKRSALWREPTSALRVRKKLHRFAAYAGVAQAAQRLGHHRSASSATYFE